MQELVILNSDKARANAWAGTNTRTYNAGYGSWKQYCRIMEVDHFCAADGMVAQITSTLLMGLVIGYITASPVRDSNNGPSVYQGRLPSWGRIDFGAEGLQNEEMEMGDQRQACEASLSWISTLL